MLTCFYFATGAIDIFVSYIIWFSLDEDLDIPIMLKDEQSQKYYRIMDVIDQSATEQQL